MNHLSLFSGIGGLDLAAEWAGFKSVAFVEIDPFCQDVLRKHWPEVPIFPNIYNVTKEILESEGVSDITLISGGFPCQPYSHAGKRKGKGDNRFLWPEMLRVIREIHPRFVVGENVYGLVTNGQGLVLESIYTDLEAEGYEVAPPFVLPAAALGALHRRDRVWICAHSRYDNGSAQQGKQQEKWAEIVDRSSRNVVPSLDKGFPEWASGDIRFPCPLVESIEDEEGEREFCGVVNGVSRRVDRLRALGNAVVPQQAYPIFQTLAEMENYGRH